MPAPRGRMVSPARRSLCRRASEAARDGFRNPPSIASEIVRADRTALRRPAAGAPILDEAEAARDLLEPLGLAHRGIGRMPEPGAGDRLEIIAADLVLVEFQNALRSPYMHVGKAQIPDPR